ncbi:hypothetical protein DOTSEDRAFT_72662 [Dothistroma septosporum NZE10]|uniref:Uncharacterized protein n=1 Tax=Dothistroma septosporum (strain NZE10 / CBS 128990) TaxID=675120 RepID=M2YMZ9_DOTSN|nr:hypothetical protein DOTSEDRAFT_72662 [Dothistroma septosporum NZE10]
MDIGSKACKISLARPRLSCSRCWDSVKCHTVCSGSSTREQTPPPRQSPDSRDQRQLCDYRQVEQAHCKEIPSNIKPSSPHEGLAWPQLHEERRFESLAVISRWT